METIFMRCASCGDVNARKENTDLPYNIAIERFYIRCPHLSAKVTLRVNPQHNDHESQAGVERMWNPASPTEEAEVDSTNTQLEDEITASETHSSESWFVVNPIEEADEDASDTRLEEAIMASETPPATL